MITNVLVEYVVAFMASVIGCLVMFVAYVIGCLVLDALGAWWKRLGKRGAR